MPHRRDAASQDGRLLRAVTTRVEPGCVDEVTWRRLGMPELEGSPELHVSQARCHAIPAPDDLRRAAAPGATIRAARCALYQGLHGRDLPRIERAEERFTTRDAAGFMIDQTTRSLNAERVDRSHTVPAAAALDALAGGGLRRAVQGPPGSRR